MSSVVGHHVTLHATKLRPTLLISFYYSLDATGTEVLVIIMIYAAARPILQAYILRKA